jgi:hypothetical protein
MPPPSAAMPHEGPYTNLLSYASAPNTRQPDRYGFHPSFRKLLFWKKDKGEGCSDCGGAGIGYGKGGGEMYNAGPGGPPMMGPANPQMGTLVFPQHTFVRSPRDWYMGQ